MYIAAFFLPTSRLLRNLKVAKTARNLTSFFSRRDT